MVVGVADGGEFIVTGVDRARVSLKAWGQAGSGYSRIQRANRIRTNEPWRTLLSTDTDKRDGVAGPTFGGNRRSLTLVGAWEAPDVVDEIANRLAEVCLLYTSPSPRDRG